MTGQALHTGHWLLGFRAYPVCRRHVPLGRNGYREGDRWAA